MNTEEKYTDNFRKLLQEGGEILIRTVIGIIRNHPDDSETDLPFQLVTEMGHGGGFHIHRKSILFDPVVLLHGVMKHKLISGTDPAPDHIPAGENPGDGLENIVRQNRIQFVP